MSHLFMLSSLVLRASSSPGLAGVVREMLLEAADNIIIRAGNESSRSLKFHNNEKCESGSSCFHQGESPNRRGLLIFVIVNHQTARRFVSNSNDHAPSLTLSAYLRPAWGCWASAARSPWWTSSCGSRGPGPCCPAPCTPPPPASPPSGCWSGRPWRGRLKIEEDWRKTEEEWLLVAAVVRAAEYRSWSDNTAVYSDPLSSLLPRHPVHLQEAHLWPHLDISTPQNTCAMIQGFSQHCLHLIYIKLDIRWSSYLLLHVMLLIHSYWSVKWSSKATRLCHLLEIKIQK